MIANILNVCSKNIYVIFLWNNQFNCQIYNKLNSYKKVLGSYKGFNLALNLSFKVTQTDENTSTCDLPCVIFTVYRCHLRWRKNKYYVSESVILTLPPNLHPLCRGTIQGPLYVELVLQNYVQWFILHQTHIYVHRFKTDKKSSNDKNKLHSMRWCWCLLCTRPTRFIEFL
jgi:hypothetical protein